MRKFYFLLSILLVRSHAENITTPPPSSGPQIFKPFIDAFSSIFKPAALKNAVAVQEAPTTPAKPAFFNAISSIFKPIPKSAALQESVVSTTTAAPGGAQQVMQIVMNDLKTAVGSVGVFISGLRGAPVSVANSKLQESALSMGARVRGFLGNMNGGRRVVVVPPPVSGSSPDQGSGQVVVSEQQEVVNEQQQEQQDTEQHGQEEQN